MRMHRTPLYLSFMFVFVSIVAGDIINGDFASDLSGWSSNDGVMSSEDPFYQEMAYLYPPEDQGVYSSILSQNFDVEGMTLLTFSFYAAVVGGGETDHLYVSLLDSSYTDEMSLSQSVDPGSSGIDPVPADSSLVSYEDSPFFFHWSSDFGEDPELAEGVTMGLPDEEDWITISLTLPTGISSATIRFELIHDYSLEDPWTTLYIDNVTLSSEVPAAVPVPAAVLLAGFGSVLAVSFRGKKNRRA